MLSISEAQSIDFVSKMSKCTTRDLGWSSETALKTIKIHLTSEATLNIYKLTFKIPHTKLIDVIHNVNSTINEFIHHEKNQTSQSQIAEESSDPFDNCNHGHGTIE